MKANRLEELDASLATVPPLTVRTPPNWTALWFFAALAALHWSIALHAFYNYRWEGFLSLGFATVFTGVAIGTWLVAWELSIRPAERRIRLRSGYRRLCIERSIPFRSVRGVRVTNSPSRSSLACKVEILCDNEDLECPPSHHPQQEALCMAMMMHVRMIKVFCDTRPTPARCDA